MYLKARITVVGAALFMYCWCGISVHGSERSNPDIPSLDRTFTDDQVAFVGRHMLNRLSRHHAGGLSKPIHVGDLLAFIESRYKVNLVFDPLVLCDLEIDYLKGIRDSTPLELIELICLKTKSDWTIAPIANSIGIYIGSMEKVRELHVSEELNLSITRAKDTIRGKHRLSKLGSAEALSIEPGNSRGQSTEIREVGTAVVRFGEASRR